MLSLPVLGLILTGLVVSGLVELFPPVVRFALSFILVSYVTGDSIRSRWLPAMPADRTSVSLLVGLSVHSIAAWLSWMLGASFSTYVIVLQVMLLGIFAAAMVTDLRRRRAAGDARSDARGEAAPTGGSGAPIAAASSRQRTPTAVLSVAALLGAFFVIAPPQTAHQGDGYDHIGFVRTILVEGDLSPRGVLAPIAGEDSVTAAKPDPRKGTLQPLLAAVCRMADVDPVDAWRWLPAFLAPVAVLAFWGFARSIMPNTAFASAAFVLFMLFQGGIARDFFSTISYGQHFSLVFYWLAFTLAIAYARRPAARTLVVIAGLTVGGGLIHLDVLVHVALGVTSLIVFAKAFRLTASSVVRLGLTCAACVALVLVWKMIISYGPGNGMHLHPQGLLYVGEKTFVPSPIELIKRYGLLFVAGVVLVPGLFLIRHHRESALMCLALAVPAIVVAFNPWLAPEIYQRAGYLVHRFLLNVPVFCVTALALGSMLAWARRNGMMAKLIGIVVLVFWGKLFLLSLTAWAADTRSIRLDDGGSSSAGAADALAGFVNERIDEGAVVLSDPVTSYWLSAYTHAKVVTVLHQHATPLDPHVFERVADVRNALSPWTSQSEALGIAQKYAVDYVLLDGASQRPVRDFMAEWFPQTVSMLEEKFELDKRTYELVYDQDGYRMFRVKDAVISDGGWYPTVPFIAKAPAGAARCGDHGVEGEAPGGPRVTSIKVEPAEALPGEKIRMSITYQRDREVVSPLPLLIHIRIEDTEYFDSTRSYPGDKYVRRFRERRDAAFRRYRFDHRPFEGVFTPELWPIGLEVRETVILQLPTDLRDASYEIQVKTTRQTLIDNYKMRDLFYNDDGYAGTPCGALKISRFVTR
jgi:hypothetical protein